MCLSGVVDFERVCARNKRETLENNLREKRRSNRIFVVLLGALFFVHIIGHCDGRLATRTTTEAREEQQRQQQQHSENGLRSERGVTTMRTTTNAAVAISATNDTLGEQWRLALKPPTQTTPTLDKLTSAKAEQRKPVDSGDPGQFIASPEVETTFGGIKVKRSTKTTTGSVRRLFDGSFDQSRSHQYRWEEDSEVEDNNNNNNNNDDDDDDENNDDESEERSDDSSDELSVASDETESNAYANRSRNSKQKLPDKNKTNKQFEMPNQPERRHEIVTKTTQSYRNKNWQTAKAIRTSANDKKDKNNKLLLSSDGWTRRTEMDSEEDRADEDGEDELETFEEVDNDDDDSSDESNDKSEKVANSKWAESSSTNRSRSKNSKLVDSRVKQSDFAFDSTPSKIQQRQQEVDICTDVHCASDEYCFSSQPDEARCVKKPVYGFVRLSPNHFVASTVVTNEKSGNSAAASAAAAGTAAYNKQSYNSSRIVQCPACPLNTYRAETICASDNRTYSSPCRLEFHNCIHSTQTKFVCRGQCPCRSARDWKHHSSFAHINSHKTNEPVYGRVHLKASSSSSSSSPSTSLSTSASFSSSLNSRRRNDILQPKSRTECTEASLNIMGARLREWFKRVAVEQKKHHRTEMKTLFSDCDASAAFMFEHFDTDNDHKLSPKELYYLDHDNAEKCLEPYLDRCDRNADRLLTITEWCQCFAPKEQPCFEHARRSKQSGSAHDEPNCTPTGHYDAMQCTNKSTPNLCWCVDRIGNEIAGTRKPRSKIDCSKWQTLSRTQNVDEGQLKRQLSPLKNKHNNNNSTAAEAATTAKINKSSTNNNRKSSINEDSSGEENDIDEVAEKGMQSSDTHKQYLDDEEGDEEDGDDDDDDNNNDGQRIFYYEGSGKSL